jgi:hypothetical protein
MCKASKKVLILTYYFPPSGGAAVQRTIKFINCLPVYNWEPIVRLQEQARLEAGDAAYNAAWERGQSLDLDTVVQELIAEFEKAE